MSTLPFIMKWTVYESYIYTERNKDSLCQLMKISNEKGGVVVIRTQNLSEKEQTSAFGFWPHRPAKD